MPLSIPCCRIYFCDFFGFPPSPESCLLRFNHLADLRPPDHFSLFLLFKTLSLSPLACILPRPLFKNSNIGPSAFFFFRLPPSFANPNFLGPALPTKKFFCALKLLTSFLRLSPPAPTICIQGARQTVLLARTTSNSRVSYYPYFGQVRPNCAVSDFKLKVL